MEYLIITCVPDNIPSARTCELSGGTFIEVADIPEDMLYEELDIDEEALVDEEKDTEYYTNRIAKGYGLVDNKIKRN